MTIKHVLALAAGVLFVVACVLAGRSSAAHATATRVSMDTAYANTKMWMRAQGLHGHILCTRLADDVLQCDIASEDRAPFALRCEEFSCRLETGR